MCLQRLTESSKVVFNCRSYEKHRDKLEAMTAKKELYCIADSEWQRIKLKNQCRSVTNIKKDLQQK